MNRFLIVGALALLGYSGSTLAQAPSMGDPCGGASILQMESQPAQDDPAMQAKMDRLAARLRIGHQQCMNQLEGVRRKDEALGISAPARPQSAAQLPTLPILTSVCSVVSSGGQPCIQKLAEQLGSNGSPEEVVYGNGCPANIELSVFYKDGSKASTTVKSKSASTLTCSDCGGVNYTEVACP